MNENAGIFPNSPYSFAAEQPSSGALPSDAGFAGKGAVAPAFP